MWYVVILTQRVYQPQGTDPSRMSCDPPDHPTKDYINRHKDLYYNNNLTYYTNGSVNNKQNTWPMNKMTGGC